MRGEKTSHTTGGAIRRSDRRSVAHALSLAPTQRLATETKQQQSAKRVAKTTAHRWIHGQETTSRSTGREKRNTTNRSQDETRTPTTHRTRAHANTRERQTGRTEQASYVSLRLAQERSKTLTREPCMHARRHGQHACMHAGMVNTALVHAPDKSIEAMLFACVC